MTVHTNFIYDFSKRFLNAMIKYYMVAGTGKKNIF